MKWVFDEDLNEFQAESGHCRYTVSYFGAPLVGLS